MLASFPMALHAVMAYMSGRGLATAGDDTDASSDASGSMGGTSVAAGTAAPSAPAPTGFSVDSLVFLKVGFKPRTPNHRRALLLVLLVFFSMRARPVAGVLLDDIH
jgi:hypothetical protein